MTDAAPCKYQGVGDDDLRPVSIFGLHSIAANQSGMFELDGDPYTVSVFGDIVSGVGDWVAVAVAA